MATIEQTSWCAPEELTPLAPSKPFWPAARTGNPMEKIYGPGPAKTCKTCVHWITHQPGANTYHKCRLRGITSGSGTDHRGNYDACGAYLDMQEVPARGQQHTFQTTWHKHLPKPTTINSATGVACPTCGLILGLRRVHASHQVIYGVSDRREYEQEIARCPMAGITKPEVEVAG